MFNLKMEHKLAINIMCLLACFALSFFVDAVIPMVVGIINGFLFGFNLCVAINGIEEDEDVVNST
jgi:hypothetical protein